MIDWLRRTPADPVVLLAGKEIPIVLRRHATARRMTMRLAPDGSEVRITLPRWGRTADALDFAASRHEWLEGQFTKLPQAAPPTPGGSLSYRGNQLAIAWAADARRKPALGEAGIVIGGPADSLAERLRRWLEAEARQLMENDLAEYCAAAGKAPPPLRMSRARQRWGSCAGDGTIRLNWRLVQAPDEIRRSVVAHEVAHLVHFDHSPAFHALLNDLYEGDVKAANRWLKQYGRSLYAQFG